jgi:hypothetical protein
MAIKDKAQSVIGDTVGRRLSGQRPGALRAAAGAAVAGGLTSAVVYRLLRHDEDD